MTFAITPVPVTINATADHLAGLRDGANDSIKTRSVVRQFNGMIVCAAIVTAEVST